MEIKTNNSRIGWSDKINDPSFLKYDKKSNLWKFIFGGTLTTVAFIGFTFFGPKSGMQKSEALLVGIVIGSMFALITAVSILRSKRRKPWSGVVIDKKQETKKRHYNDSEGRDKIKEYEEFSVIVRDNSTGKERILCIEENSTFKYDYFNIGDQVKYHAIGSNGIEKYDKSKDNISFCLACNYLNDIENDECEMCKCPIIK